MTTTQPQHELSVSSTDELRSRARRSLENCGVDLSSIASGPTVTARSPITGEALFDVPAAGPAELEAAIAAAKSAFAEWRVTPAPVRGGLVKRLGTLLTEHKADKDRATMPLVPTVPIVLPMELNVVHTAAGAR